jgi:hypothetical protein
MLTSTNYSISTKVLQVLQEALLQLPTMDNRLVLNQKTSTFFYDPWEIKPEFKGTIWEDILNSLLEPKGEARLIKLDQGTAYPSHADIDDRWHLTLQGNHSYLIDLESNTMYSTNITGQWVLMDAGRRHTAANFGSGPRIQLVIRKLLPRNKLKDPITVHLTLKKVVEDRRFIFDNIISPWLNRAYKQGIIDNFIGKDLIATFDIEIGCLDQLKELTRGYFVVSVDV